MAEEETDYGIPPLAPLDTNDEELTPPVSHKRTRKAAPLPGLDDDSGNQTTEEDLKLQGILNSEEYTGSTFNIQRRDEMGKYAYLMSIPISDWSEDTKRIIADKYGGGEYKVRVRKAGGGTFGRTFNFSIDPAVKPKGFEATGNQGNSLDLIRQAKMLTGDNTPLLMQMMQAQQAQSMQFMQMMQQQSAENMKALVSIMARPVAAAPAGNERIVELLLTKALTPPPPPPPPMDIEKMIAVVAKLRELTDSGAAAEPEEKQDFFSDVMRALPSILKSFATIRLPAPQQQIEQPKPQAAPVAQGVPVPPQNPPPPAPADAASVNKAALAQFLPQLVSAAEEDADTDDFATLIDGAMDDDQFDGIIELLKRDDWFAILADAHDPVMRWSNWFTRLRTSLLKMAEGDENEEAIDVESVPVAS